MKVALLLVSVLISVSAQADIVYMKNGDRISGELKEVWDDKITIEPDYTDEFDIDLEDVQSLETDGPFDIELFDEREGEFTLIRSELDGQVTLRGFGEDRTLALTDIKHIEEIEDYFEWDARLDLNSTLSRGDTESWLGVLNAELELKRGDHRTDYDLAMAREEVGNDRVKDSDRLDVSYNFLFSDPWYFAMNITAERDPVARLHRRTSVNPALGYDIFDNPGQQLSVEFGAGFNTEIIADVEQEGTVLDWRLKWERDILNGDIELFHNQNIYKNLDGRENIVIYTETGMRYEITDDIFLNMQLNFKRDSEPASGTRTDDSTFVIGAGIDF